MTRTLIGKYLVRKAKTQDGKDVITLTGVFHPKNFNIREINDGGEMWVSDIIISGGMKFSDLASGLACSPEDFLSGMCQSPDVWNNKSDL